MRETSAGNTAVGASYLVHFKQVSLRKCDRPTRSGAARRSKRSRRGWSRKARSAAGWPEAMRSVSLFLPAGLRTPSKTPQGPASQQAPLRPAPPESENHSGVGIVLDASEDGRLVVEHVWPGSPAAVAGIRPGDVLLLIDGMQGSVSSIDVARDLIRGVEGTTVTLQVLRGITQHEFGPMRRAAWVTMQQVYASSACVFPPFNPFPSRVRLSG